MQILYVYSVTREPVTPEVEGVDGTGMFGAVSAGAVSAVYSGVDSGEFSQETIDRRAGDLEWLGAIGYRHQEVVAALVKKTALVPLRAFTLFSSEEAIRSYLLEHQTMLVSSLDRLDGKQEWTVRVEFDPARWSEALVRRVPAFGELQREIASATPGRAFLLRKKLDEERKHASRAAEQAVVAEIEQEVLGSLRCEAVAETREHRDGAFPQIHLLIARDEEATLQELHERLLAQYEPDGVILGLTGPWPPYTFSTMTGTL